MKKDELIDHTAKATGFSKAMVREVLDEAASVVRSAISCGQDVFLFGLGKLERRQRGTKKARDLHTGAVVFVPPRRVVVFKPSDSLTAAANS